MILTKAQKVTAIKEDNSLSMHKLLKVSVARIKEQGSGCVDSMGPAYINKQDKTRDAIAIVATGLKDKYFGQFYGKISEEKQKPIVRNLLYNFSINILILGEREWFVDFLQALQDAHDDAFDPYNKEIPGMEYFEKRCLEIKKDFGL